MLLISIIIASGCSSVSTTKDVDVRHDKDAVSHTTYNDYSREIIVLPQDQVEIVQPLVVCIKNNYWNDSAGFVKQVVSLLNQRNIDVVNASDAHCSQSVLFIDIQQSFKQKDILGNYYCYSGDATITITSGAQNRGYDNLTWYGRVDEPGKHCLEKSKALNTTVAELAFKSAQAIFEQYSAYNR